MRTSWILIAPVLWRQVGQRRLHRDQPVEEVLLLVLEADVEHVGLAARGDVAGHLEGHRRLAGALGAADQQQLARPQARPDRLVERGEAEGDRLELANLAAGHAVIEVDQDVERRARRHAAVGGLESPHALFGLMAGSAASVLTRMDPPGAASSRILAPGGARITGPDPTFPHSQGESLSAAGRPVRPSRPRRSGSPSRGWPGTSTRWGHGRCRRAA